MSWWDEQCAARRTAIDALLDTEHGVHYLRYAGGDRGFTDWLLVADRRCVRSFGVSIFDQSDWMWRDAYDGDQSPADAVRDAVEADDRFSTRLGGDR
jgi:hypothetical protein